MKNKKIISTCCLILFAVSFFIPLIWMVLAAFDDQAIQSLRWPTQFSFENFSKVLGHRTAGRGGAFTSSLNMVQGFINSILMTMAQTVIVMIFSLLAAYPLSKYKLSRGQEISMVLLFLTALPVLAIMVPVYQLFLIFNMVDSQISVVLFMSAAALPYGIWMCKNFYDSVPEILEEVAWIDGASRIQGMIHVILPLMLPGIFTVAIYTFIHCWGNFFVPFILLMSPHKYTAAINIYRFFGEEGEIIYGQVAAYSMMYTIPVIVLYSLAQGYMSKGFALGGSVKS
jgi:multiple sugar transport system permease protein